MSLHWALVVAGTSKVVTFVFVRIFDIVAVQTILEGVTMWSDVLEAFAVSSAVGGDMFFPNICADLTEETI